MRRLFTKRESEVAEEEARARGDYVEYFTEEATSEFRHQVLDLINDLSDELRRNFEKEIGSILVREYGVPFLVGPNLIPEDDFRTFVLKRAKADQIMDIIHITMDLTERSYGSYKAYLTLVRTVSIRLRENKMAYDLVDGQIVRKKSQELHAAVVQPALTLLHGRKRFSEVERQYQDGLKELSEGHWGDAVTDANAAVELALRIVLGYEQGQLPSLLGEARKKGYFGQAQERSLRRAVDGFSALSEIRNSQGDAHGNTTDEATAWLCIHWAGALIVYIVQRDEDLNFSR
ncbi:MULTISPECIES: AbiJ-NTD4 domain-containing protein [Protofrankia]|uniref:AbiJ-NTD4 domain-containing protein n=1 Tax=Protofrankia TaxID=2994361 RepID=UPI00104166AD|nr:MULTISPECIES: hypothetical protein [Protofrankia]